jgi:hypothetical protein
LVRARHRVAGPANLGFPPLQQEFQPVLLRS